MPVAVSFAFIVYYISPSRKKQHPKPKNGTDRSVPFLAVSIELWTVDFNSILKNVDQKATVIVVPLPSLLSSVTLPP